MAVIRHRIEHIIETDPVIKKGLQRGIINSRALVRFMQETNKVDGSTESILGVIRRYPLGHDRESFPSHVFADCEITMRTKVGDLSLENGTDVMQRIAEFARTVKTTRGENLRVIVGHKAVRIIADQKALGRFRQTLRDQEVLRYEANLVEISLLFPPEAEETKGVYAKIVTELTLNDVNIVGINCCSPESILLIAEKDGPRAFSVLHQLVLEEAKISHNSPHERPAN